MQQVHEADIVQASLLPAASAAAARDVLSDAMTIRLYRNEVPPFAEAELERLYENPFSSIGLLRIYGTIDENTHTYVVSDAGRITTIFLFRLEQDRARVLNEVIAIEQNDIDRFAAFIFQTFSTVNAVVFHAVQTAIRSMCFPCQRFNCLEDIVLDLPDTEQAYHAELGKNTRRKIRRYTEKLVDTFPSFRFSLYQKQEVSEQYVRQIIELNRARMMVKNKSSMLDDQETARILSLVQSSGMVSVVTIDGRLCAGTICFQSGSNCFLSVLAHDPAYDAYWLGILCCYLTICECIARHGKRFHFLWGRYDFKYMLRAKTVELDHLVIYRSRPSMLLNGPLVLKTAAAGALRQINLLLHAAKRADSRWGRLARDVLRQGRRLKWIASGLFGRRD